MYLFFIFLFLEVFPLGFLSFFSVVFFSLFRGRRGADRLNARRMK